MKTQSVEPSAQSPIGNEHAPLCRRCKVPMVVGKATEQTWVMGVPDFPGNTINSIGQTLNVGGPGKLIECLKCPKCGHSVTLGVKAPDENRSPEIVEAGVEPKAESAASTDLGHADLWTYFAQNHNLHLLGSELHDIILAVLSSTDMKSHCPICNKAREARK